MLKNYINCAKKVKNKLVTNAKIRQILFYNTEDALSKETPSEAEILNGNYILTKPMESLSLKNVENMQSTFIAITVPNLVFDNTSSAASVIVNVACSNEIWDLKEGNRLLILANEIIKQLQHNDFGFAGKMEVQDMDLIEYNGNFSGYTITFIIVDELHTNVEII